MEYIPEFIALFYALVNVINKLTPHYSRLTGALRFLSKVAEMIALPPFKTTPNKDPQ